ncbi:MAG: V-type ATP synthase subunit E family protein [Ignisphaera sp.]
MSSELKRVILSKAEEEAKKIISKAEEEAKKIIEEAYNLKQQEILKEKERIAKEVNYETKIAEARLRARMIIAEAKNEILELLKKYVWNYLNNLNPVLREQSLLNLTKEAINAILEDLSGSDKKVVIYVSKKELELAKKVAEFLSKELNLVIDVKEMDILGGVVVSSPDGNIMIDNSYENRLKRVIEIFLSELRKEVFS